MKIPQIKEESTGQYNIDNYIHAKEYVITPKRNKKYGSKTETQEWNELILDIRKKIEENSVEDSKPTNGTDCNIQTQSQDFVYDFHEVYITCSYQKTKLPIDESCFHLFKVLQCVFFSISSIHL